MQFNGVLVVGRCFRRVQSQEVADGAVSGLGFDDFRFLQHRTVVLECLQELRPELRRHRVPARGLGAGTGGEGGYETLLADAKKAIQRERWATALKAYKQALVLKPDSHEAKT